jgi:hypothetical protein
MSKSRSPSKRRSDAAGGGLEPTQKSPTGILPASLVKGDVNAAAMLTKAFAVCHPNVDDIGELDKSERAAWIHLSDGLLRGHKAAVEILKGIEQMVERQVEAEIQDRDERRAEELKDAAARRKREGQSHAQELKMCWEEHEQGLAERTVSSANQSLRERLVLAMTAISFGCMIASLLFVFLAGPQVVSGSSVLFFGTASIMGMIRTLVFKREKEDEKGPSPPHVSE